VSGVVVDTSAWIEFFAGRPVAGLEQALAQSAVWATPVIVSELISGVRGGKRREALLDLLSDFPLCDFGLEHWVRVGDLRRGLAAKGLSVSTPDAHIAQSALDQEALLLSRDGVFSRIAEVVPLLLAKP